jgi:nucleotide-binding universal stress UspA family protein
MSADERPVVVAFDGSPESEAAVRTAAALFAGRRLVVVSVWEPGLALAMTTPPDGLSGLSYAPPSAETMRAVDDVQRGHASEMAETGAAIARELGAEVEPYPVPDELAIAETLAGVADERDAAALVVGSRGLGRVKARLLGSTSQGLLHHTRRPVVVVRAPDEPQPPPEGAS